MILDIWIGLWILLEIGLVYSVVNDNATIKGALKDFIYVSTLLVVNFVGMYLIVKYYW